MLKIILSDSQDLKNWNLSTGRILTGTLKSILQEASLHEWDRHGEHREPGRQLHDGVVYHRGLDCLRHTCITSTTSALAPKAIIF